MKFLRVTCCLFIFLLSLVAFTFVAVHPAAAQGLNPPPPQGANCHTSNQGTLCQGTVPFSDVNADIGIPSCGSFQVLETATYTNTFIFSYNQDGNMTKGIGDSRVVGTLSNSVTGTSVPEEAHVAITETFATPGDLSTVTLTNNGQGFYVNLPGSGLILLDVGRVVFAPDLTITFESGGPHQVINGDTQKLCDALS